MIRHLMLLLLIMFSGNIVALGQLEDGGAKGPRVGIKHIIPEISVVAEIQTGKDRVVVATCSFRDAFPVLCQDSVSLEVWTGRGWREARMRTTFGVLGGPGRDVAQGRVLPAMTESLIIYEFSRRFYEVEAGQRLRLVINAWADEQAMKNRSGPIHLISPTFVCPPSGFGK